MGIWTYADNSRDPAPLAEVTVCPYCGASMSKLFSEQYEGRSRNENFHDFEGFVCQICGWWKAIRETGVWGEINRESCGLQKYTSQTFCSVGALKSLDLKDLTTPLADVRSFLLARYETRLSLHPRLFEETVGSVFASLGYKADVTAYSNDGGVDIFLKRGGETEPIGVQVKRYKNSIGVEQIRELTGALVDGGITKGIFVTTSQFQAGAHSMAERLGRKGFAIELMDAKRFYDALRLAQRPAYLSKEDLLVGRDFSNMARISSFDGY